MRHILTLFAIVAITGCGSFSVPKPKMPEMPTISLPKLDLPFLGRQVVEVPGLTPTVVEPQAEWTPYPRQAPYGEDLDIVVQQGRHSLTTFNREPKSFAGMQLWLNQQYVATLVDTPIGAGPAIDLFSFINAHGETYPEPGFLTPETGYPIVSAEFFNPATGQRHRLLARHR